MVSYRDIKDPVMMHLRATTKTGHGVFKQIHWKEGLGWVDCGHKLIMSMEIMSKLLHIMNHSVHVALKIPIVPVHSNPERASD